MDLLGSGVMGLSFKCARCHTHKFDPIPHRDYYRLLAVFKGAFDEHDWMKSNWHPALSMGQRSDRDLPVVTTAERREWEAREAALTREIETLRAAQGPAAGGPVNSAPGSKKVADEAARKIAAVEARRTPAPAVRALW